MNLLACLCEQCSKGRTCPCVAGSMFLGAALAVVVLLFAWMLSSRGRSDR